MRNGLAMPGPQAAVQIAQPLNDVQLLSLMAVQLPGDAKERVRLAMDIMAEAIVQFQGFKGILEAKKALE